MIVAIANRMCGGSEAIMRALTAMRMGSGRKVLLLDAAPASEPEVQLGAPPAHIGGATTLQATMAACVADYDDVLIDTSGRDPSAQHAAMLCARKVVVPVRVDQVDLERQYPLIARLNAARMFNPGLAVLFVCVADQGYPSRAQLAQVRAYVGQVMSASLVGTVTLATPDGAAMHALYRQLFIL